MTPPREVRAYAFAGGAGEAPPITKAVPPGVDAGTETTPDGSCTR